MDFTHTPYQPGETIAAISTPLGEGGVGIVRLSGVRAIEIASKIFSGPVASYPSHSAHLGILRDLHGKRVDQVLLLLMRGPRSYTGEDTVELQCHGGLIVTRKILEVCLAAGARAALPGEFTFKAFMNGKLDLAQAEAVQKLVHAKSEQALEIADQQLAGVLSNKIQSFQKELIRLGAILEAWVDFPDEGLEFITFEKMIAALEGIENEMRALIHTFHDGKRIEKGISLCIVGSPNAGKSSLMNALLEMDRAIVTPIAGTTRDLLHEDLTFGGLHFRLTDTAGIRYTEEIVEQEGIRRSKAAVESADIILLVLDASRPVSDEDRAIIEFLPKEKTIALWNKIDLSTCSICPTPFLLSVQISAKERLGIETLKQTINRLVWQKGVPPKDEVIITTLRHKEALTEAVNSLSSLKHGLMEGISPEFLTADLRSALTELGKMLGTNVTEEILSSIFSQFCIGK
jgi:tRNA modification GTPase